MGLLTFEYNKDDFPDFMRIAAALPTMSNQILGFVGNESKKILKQELLSGQMLDYKGFKDKRGRTKASYGIKYGQYVTIRSYPANFFTVSNPRQKKRAIWSDLKAKTNSKLGFILKEFDRKYLEDMFKEFTDSPRSRQRF